MRTSRWKVIIITFLLQAPLWLLFTANTDWREWIAAGIATAISTIGVAVYGIKGKASFVLRWRDVIQAWRLPWYALSGTWEIMQGLAKQLFTAEGAPSFLGAVRFEVGEGPAAAGRRALAESYTTMTPNSVVLGVICSQRLLLYHQIIPGDILGKTRELGARP